MAVMLHETDKHPVVKPLAKKSNRIAQRVPPANAARMHMRQTCSAVKANGWQWVDEPTVKIEKEHIRFNHAAFTEFGLEPRMLFDVTTVLPNHDLIEISQFCGKLDSFAESRRPGAYTLRSARCTDHKYGNGTWAGFFHQTGGLTLTGYLPGLIGMTFPMEQDPSDPKVFILDTRRGTRWLDTKTQKMAKKVSAADIDRVVRRHHDGFEDFDGL